MKTLHLSFINLWVLFLCLTLSLSSVYGNVGNHTLFIKSDGSLWGMGSNSHGQLGNGNNTNLTTPQVLIDANSSNPIIEITHGYNHSLFLRKDGSLWAMGMNNFGQLGDGTTTHRSTPVKIVDSNVVRISAGYFHSLFLKSNGSLWGMGSNTCGELGINLAGGSNTSYDAGIDQNSPVEIVSSGVAQMSGGRFFTIFVKIDGSLWGMGEVDSGRLAQPWVGGNNDSFDAANDHKVPIRILNSGVVEAEAGAQYSLIRKTDGSAWSFGDNWHGQLADGNRPSHNREPFQFLEANVTQISASWSIGSALLSDGSLRMWGANHLGQLGDGSLTDRNQSTEIFSTGVSQVSTGSDHTIILKNDGSLWTVGSGKLGQLGNGQSGGTSEFDVGIDLKTPFLAVSSGVTQLPNFHEYNKPNLSPDLNSTVNLEMIWVEPGTFTMGDLNGTGAADERPSHQVTLTKGFYLGKYEVTKEQYELVMTGNDLGFSPTPYAGGGTGANTPIVYISYNEVVAFIDRFNQQQSGETQIGWEYILPTEAQWEYARRAGSTSVWGNFDLSDGPYDLSTGDSYANAQTVLEFNGSLANYNAGAGSPFLHKDVGQYPPNSWGFHDMSGSASEWVADWLGSYSSDSQTDPQGPSIGTDRVIRGGSLENQRVHQTSSNRGGSPPEWKRYSTGFRLAYMYTNMEPTDLNSTAPLTIAENQPIGNIVGEFNATDPDANATLTYSLVNGNGSGDNSLFTLDANGVLKTATTFDYENNASSYSIRVQAKDEYNATSEGNFTINLTDVLENSAPQFTFSGNTIINSNFGVEFFPTQNPYSVALDDYGSPVKLFGQTFDAKNFSGRFTLDVNPGYAGNGDVFKIYQENNILFNSGPWKSQGPYYTYDFDRFIIDFSQGIQTTFEFVPLDTNDATNTNSGQTPNPNGIFDNKSYYLDTLGLNDDGSPSGISQILGKRFSSLGQVTTNPADNNSTIFTIEVETANFFTYKAFYQPIAPSISVHENNLFVTDINATDPNGDNIIYSLSGGSDFSKFDINATSGSLFFINPQDFEANNSTRGTNYFEVIVTASDGELNSSVIIPVLLLDVNDAPTDLNATAPLTIAENQPIGTVVGEFNATDPDVNATLTYSLVDGNGSTDNFLLTLDTNGTLTTATFFDYESNASSYSIRVQARDEYNATVEKAFTISLLDVYEPSQPNHVVDLNNSVNLEMIWVEPGTFTMGSPVTEANRGSNEIEHNVTLTKGFYLGKHEVTQAQYEAVMTGVTGDLNATPSHFHGYPNRPVERVSWEDVQIFLTRINSQQSSSLPSGWAYVLPTEAEWEYACRAGTITAYHWGNTTNSSFANYANFIGNTVDVGQFAPNHWGFFDMHGNVWEWVSDWYGLYDGAAVSDPQGPSAGTRRGRKGGAWNYYTSELRAALHYGSFPDSDNKSLGFRLGFKNLNKSPTDLNSSGPLAIAENQPIGTIVGEFNATDPDANATLTFSLVDGNGSTDNSLFTLDANGTLKIAALLDYETASTRSIRVQAKDEFNATVEKIFTVSLTNVNEPASGSLTISGIPRVGEVLTVSNTLSDPDGNGSVTYQWLRNDLPFTPQGLFKNGVNGVDGLEGPANIAFSPNEDFLYVSVTANDSITWYQRDSLSGGLLFKGMIRDGVNGVDGLNGAYGLAVSPDGKHLFATGKDDHAVSWYILDSMNGTPSFGGMLKDNQGGVDGLYNARTLSISPDGKHVYVAAAADDAISRFERNATSGALSYLGLSKQGVGGVDGLDSVIGLAMSSSGDYVYSVSAADDAVAWFARNASDGSLSYQGRLKDGVDGVDGLNEARHVSLSPDGHHLYATAISDDAVSWFGVNPSTGALAYGGQVKNGSTGTFLNAPISVLIPPDGKHAYITASKSHSLSWYERNASTGALTYSGSLRDGIGQVDGLGDAFGLALSSNGQHVYATGGSDHSLVGFERNASSGVLSTASVFGSSYTLTIADFSSTLSVVASYTDGGGFDENVTSSATDQIQAANQAPTDLNATAPLSISENQPIGTVVGEFNATDPDPNATLTFSLVNVNGSTDNALFTLDTNGTLTTAASFDYESNASTYSIRVQAKDEYNATTEKVFSVSLSDVNEAPVNLNSVSTLTIAENQPIGTIVGEFNATDPEGHSFTFSLASNTWETHNEYFNIDANGTLRTASVLNYETIHRWKKVRVQATDELGATSIQLFPVTIEDVNDAPRSNTSIEFSTPEGQSWSTLTWNRVYGGNGNDIMWDMIPAHDDGHLLVGTSDSNASGNKSNNSKGKKDFWVIKIDLAGNKLWDVTIGGSGDDHCAGIIPTSDGNYLLYGSSDSPSDGDKSQASHGDDDFWIVKIDQNGSKIWDKRYGAGNPDRCRFALELNSGDFVLGGMSLSGTYADKESPGLGNEDAWLIRIDENGTKIWDYSYGGSSDDNLHNIEIMSDGNFLLFANSRSDSGDYKNSSIKGWDDYWALKVNEHNGSIIWDKSYGGSAAEYYPDGLLHEDGSFIMVGLSMDGSASTADRQSSAKSTRDLWVVKADANGSILWEKSFAGDSTKGMGWTTRIISHDDGGYLIANTTNGVAENDVSRGPHHGDTQPDYWLLKIDAYGNKVWDRRYGGYGGDYSTNLLPSPDGGYFLIGNSGSIAGYDKSQANVSEYGWISDFWVLKLDEHGNKANTLHDPEGEELTWTISGGADAGYFEINSTTGEISFSGADYANPQDADQNNDYDVTIRATDTSGLNAEQTVRVSIEYPFDEANGDAFLEAGLVAWYPFDGNASDMSGNGNHGTIYGTVPGTDRKGEAGKALSFDGTDDRVKIPHSLLHGRVQFTYNLWYKSTDASEPYAGVPKCVQMRVIHTRANHLLLE